MGPGRGVFNYMVRGKLGAGTMDKGVEFDDDDEDEDEEEMLRRIGALVAGF